MLLNNSSYPWETCEWLSQDKWKGVSVHRGQSFIIRGLCYETVPWVGKKLFQKQMLVARLTNTAQKKMLLGLVWLCWLECATALTTENASPTGFSCSICYNNSCPRYVAALAVREAHEKIAVSNKYIILTVF